MSFSQIAYVAWIPFTKRDFELGHFSRFAERHHPALDVTGALAVGHGSLLHFLEGPPKSVQSLFNVMTHFPHHRHPMAIHWKDGVPARLFPNHALAIIRIDQDASADIARHWHRIDAPSILCGGGMPSGILELLPALSRHFQIPLRLAKDDE
ncbi:MAG: BLUF domain-containing protein [Phycisphaerales bacterium]|nr:BLUF domain-containing protein [Phycisphaerales bacterium]MCB9863388.1 BLUF domain-containing protein [Phycisphaerales bacterium]